MQKVDGNSISLQSSLSFLKAIGIWSVGLGGLRRTVSSVGKNHVIYWMMDMLKFHGTHEYYRLELVWASKWKPTMPAVYGACGYEPAAVEATFGSWNGFLRTARLALFGPPRDQPEPISALPEERQAPVFPVLPIIDSVPAKTVA